jgi:hypothetical protein
MAHRLICTPQDGGALSESDIEQRQGLRCRFVSSLGTASEVPASYTGDGCSAQCTVEKEVGRENCLSCALSFLFFFIT